MAANPHRSTIAVDLGGVLHDLCLTNSALAEVETELGRNCLALLPSEGEPNKIGIREATVVIHAALRGAGMKVARPGVVDLLDKMRPMDVIMAALQALAAAFTDPDPNPRQEGASPSERSLGAN